VTFQRDSFVGAGLQLPNGVAKARSRALTALVDGFTDCYDRMLGSLQRVCVVEVAADSRRFVGHTKSYAQACPTDYALIYRRSWLSNSSSFSPPVASWRVISKAAALHSRQEMAKSGDVTNAPVH